MERVWSRIFNDWDKWFSKMYGVNNIAKDSDTTRLSTQKYKQLFSGDIDTHAPFNEDGLRPYPYHEPVTVIDEKLTEQSTPHTEIQKTADFSGKGRFLPDNVYLTGNITRGSEVTVTIESMEDNSVTGVDEITYDSSTGPVGYMDKVGTENVYDELKYRSKRLQIESGSIKKSKKFRLTVNIIPSEDAESPTVVRVGLIDTIPEFRRGDSYFYEYPDELVTQYNQDNLDRYNDIARLYNMKKETLSERLPASSYKDDTEYIPEDGETIWPGLEVAKPIRDAHVNITSVTPSTIPVIKEGGETDMHIGKSGTVRVTYGSAHMDTPISAADPSDLPDDWCGYDWELDNTEYKITLSSGGFQKTIVKQKPGMAKIDYSVNSADKMTVDVKVIYDFIRYNFYLVPDGDGGVDCEIVSTSLPSPRETITVSDSIDVKTTPQSVNWKAASLNKETGHAVVRMYRNVPNSKEKIPWTEMRVTEHGAAGSIALKPGKVVEEVVNIPHGVDLRHTDITLHARASTKQESYQDAELTVALRGQKDADFPPRDSSFADYTNLIVYEERKQTFGEEFTYDNGKSRFKMAELDTNEITHNLATCQVLLGIGNLERCTRPNGEKRYTSEEGPKKLYLQVKLSEDANETNPRPQLYYQLRSNKTQSRPCPINDEPVTTGGFNIAAIQSECTSTDEDIRAHTTTIRSQWSHTFYRRAEWDVLQKIKKDCGTFHPEDVEEIGDISWSYRGGPDDDWDCHKYRELGNSMHRYERMNSNSDPGSMNPEGISGKLVEPIYPSPVRPVQSYLLPVNRNISAGSYNIVPTSSGIESVTRDSMSIKAPIAHERMYCPLEKRTSVSPETIPRPPDYIPPEDAPPTGSEKVQMTNAKNYTLTSSDDSLGRRCHSPEIGLRSGPNNYYSPISSFEFSTTANPYKIQVSPKGIGSKEIDVKQLHHEEVSVNVKQIEPLRTRRANGLEKIIWPKPYKQLRDDDARRGGVRSDRGGRDDIAETTKPPIAQNNEYLTENEIKPEEVQLKIKLREKQTGRPISTELRGNQWDGLDGTLEDESNYPLGSRFMFGGSDNFDKEHIVVRVKRGDGGIGEYWRRVETDRFGNAFVVVPKGYNSTIEVFFRTNNDWWKTPTDMKVLNESSTTMSQSSLKGYQKENVRKGLPKFSILFVILISVYSALSYVYATAKQIPLKSAFKQLYKVSAGFFPDYVMPTIVVFALLSPMISFSDPSAGVIIGVAMILLYIFVR
jgi:hypothetical protein